MCVNCKQRCVPMWMQPDHEGSGGCAPTILEFRVRDLEKEGNDSGEKKRI